jgi:FMN-dependent NADH-azoreductase
MTQILQLESSLFPAEMSSSRRVSKQLVDALVANEPGSKVVVRDLAANPLNHIGLDLMLGSTATADSHSEAQSKAVAASNELIAELFAADVIVIGVPMYNFSIPSTLKAWVDHIAIGGKTFSYTAEGRPQGLVTGKKVFIVASRGGAYSEGPMAAFNFQDPYLRSVLAFLGMTDITVITAEQQKMGPDAQAAGFAHAEKSIAAALRVAQPA